MRSRRNLPVYVCPSSNEFSSNVFVACACWYAANEDQEVKV